MKYFLITWYEKKDKQKIHRTHKISIKTNSSDIGVTAKRATDLFCLACGNLNKNEIVSIQEVDENNVPIGEPITPMDGSTIVPTRR